MKSLVTLGNEIITLILNIVLLSSVPFVWFVLSRRRIKGFFQYLGIYRPTVIDIFGIVKIILPIYLLTLAAILLVIATGNSQRSTGDVENNAWWVILIGLFLYGLTTGIAEEILFRGFIAKRCFSLLGYQRGNLLQALIFALPHVVINGSASSVDILVRIINAFLLGYSFGYVVERKSCGSILPVMTAHIFINIINSSILMAVL